MADARKGSCGNSTCPREDNHGAIHSQTGKNNELGSSKGAESYDKESGVQISEERGCTMYNIRRSSRLSSKNRNISYLQNQFQCDENGSQCRVDSPKISIDKNNLAFAREAVVGNMPQVQHRYENNGACQAENAFASSMRPSTSVPIFEFYVRSEEGINIFVDLNSNPSDWFERLENEVCISQNLQKNKFLSFRQELECLGNSNKQMKSSLLKNTDSEIGMNNGHVQTDSSPISTKIVDGHVGLYQPDGGDGSLGFSAAKPSAVAIEMSAHSEEEKEMPVLSRLSSDISNQMVSYTESCPRDGETKTTDSNVLDTPHVILACKSVVNLTSDGPEILNALEDQNSKLDNENCVNIALHNTCSLENPSAVYSGCSAIGSMEFQLPEVASHQNDSSCFPSEILNLVDTLNNAERGDGGLANSIEVNHNTYGNHAPTCTEKWERGHPVNGTENSNPLEKRVEDLGSVGSHKRKRRDVEIAVSCDQNDGRVLRSTKRLGERVLPRRSMRLVSKVVLQVATFIGEYLDPLEQ